MPHDMWDLSLLTRYQTHTFLQGKHWKPLDQPGKSPKFQVLMTHIKERNLESCHTITYKKEF